MNLLTVELDAAFYGYLVVELALLFLLWRWYLGRPVKSAMLRVAVALATLLVAGPLVLLGVAALLGKLAVAAVGAPQWLALPDIIQC